MPLDHISNLLTHIRNASKVKHTITLVPFTTINFAILKVLKKENYILHYTLETEKNNQKIKIFLKYDGWWIQKPSFSILKRISKPGQRIFLSYKQLYTFLPTLKYKQGIAILSTSLGVMSHIKAIKLKQGGEVLCYIE